MAKIKEREFKLLNTKKGIKLRKQRCHDVEPVFAELKYNKNFKRFMLRGKTKVEVEIGILAIAHNLKKMSKVAFFRATFVGFFKFIIQVFQKKYFFKKAKPKTSIFQITTKKDCPFETASLCI